MPAFNEEAFVGGVVRGIPDYVDVIIVVDDASSDGTAQAVVEVGDSRVQLVRHKQNRGLGGSLISAHLTARQESCDISVVMAGDGQMDPCYLPLLLDPLIDEGYDFSKGNRFFSTSSVEGMPRVRVLGNILLTLLTKVATGYWNLADPQNGYTAITRRMQQAIDWNSVVQDYSFENDVIARLGILRARIRDVDIPAVYGNEVSDIRLGRVVPDILRTLRRSFWRRIWYRHILRGFSPAAAAAISGLPLLAWSLGFGGWVVYRSIGPAQATTGTIMLVVLPFLMGFIFMVAAWILDVVDAPR